MKKNKNEKILENLRKSLDWCEGKYSGLPDCCIQEYVNGMTYKKFRDCLSEKDRKKLDKNTLKWQYVPCMNCFKKNKSVKIKHNGVSLQGRMIMTLMEDFFGVKYF